MSISGKSKHIGQHGHDCQICVNVNTHEAIEWTAHQLNIPFEQARIMRAAPVLLAALEKIMQMTATSPLEACAYQGPPPKKWLREVAPALQARYNAVREAQKIARAAIAQAQQT